MACCGASVYLIGSYSVDDHVTYYHSRFVSLQSIVNYIIVKSESISKISYLNESIGGISIQRTNDDDDGGGDRERELELSPARRQALDALRDADAGLVEIDAESWPRRARLVEQEQGRPPDDRAQDLAASSPRHDPLPWSSTSGPRSRGTSDMNSGKSRASGDRTTAPFAPSAASVTIRSSSSLT